MKKKEKQNTGRRDGEDTPENIFNGTFVITSFLSTVLHDMVVLLTALVLLA